MICTIFKCGRFRILGALIQENVFTFWLLLDTNTENIHTKKPTVISNNWYAGKWNAHHISFYNHFTSQSVTEEYSIRSSSIHDAHLRKLCICMYDVTCIWKFWTRQTNIFQHIARNFQHRDCLTRTHNFNTFQGGILDRQAKMDRIRFLLQKHYILPR